MKLTAAKCPSCGANIKVDRSLKFTKCEYCNSRIIVEKAIENYIQVEIKDIPTLDNYLKLGNRYYNNKEFSEAYKAYSKAEEIDPDNPLVILRKGLSHSLASDYNHFEVSSAVTGLKSSLSLMKKMSFSSDDINKSISETLEVLIASRNYLLEVYQNHQHFTMDQTIGYIERLEACLDGFYYLDSIVDKGTKLEQDIVKSIVENIDMILGKANDSSYQLEHSYIKKLQQKRKQYITRINGSYSSSKVISKGKVVAIDEKNLIIYDILCYLTVFFLGIMFLGSIFSHESYLLIIIWLFALLSFIPPIKKAFIKYFGIRFSWIIIVVRTVLLVIAFLLLASSKNEFDNTFKGDDGVLITFDSGKYTLKNDSQIIEGEYDWDVKDSEYYIHVKTNDNNYYEYRYHSTSEGGNLCLLQEKKCNKIYLPVD